jgi:hypothetical protein
VTTELLGGPLSGCYKEWRPYAPGTRVAWSVAVSTGAALLDVSPQHWYEVIGVYTPTAHQPIQLALYCGESVE